MAKHSKNKITYTHWIIIGGALAVILLLLQYGYGGLIKTQVASSPEVVQCRSEARDRKYVCRNKADDLYNATIKEINSFFGQPPRGQRQRDAAALVRTNAKDACNTTYDKEYAACDLIPTAPPAPGNSCNTVFPGQNRTWCPGGNSGALPGGLCCQNQGQVIQACVGGNNTNAPTNTCETAIIASVSPDPSPFTSTTPPV